MLRSGGKVKERGEIGKIPVFFLFFYPQCARFSRRSNCCVRLAWLIKCLLCKLRSRRCGSGKIRVHPSHNTTLPTNANSPSCKWKPTVLKMSTRAIYIPTSIMQGDQGELNCHSGPCRLNFISFRLKIRPLSYITI